MLRGIGNERSPISPVAGREVHRKRRAVSKEANRKAGAELLPARSESHTVASLRAIGPTGPAALELLVFETYVLRASVAIGCPTVLRGDEVCVLVKLCWLARALFIFVGNSLGQSGQY
jgi:hypothetical protein